MSLTWPQIIVALEHIGSNSPGVQPGLPARVMRRLFPEQLPPAASRSHPATPDGNGRDGASTAAAEPIPHL